MTAAIYVRVSKEEQHTDNQLPELRAEATRQGWDIAEYIEHASGKAGARRPVLAKLMEDAKAGKFGVVMVWKIDRFGRSLIDFCQNVRALDDMKVRFIATTQSIDTDQRSPFAKLLMHILAVFAEFERDLIVERVNLGLKEYRRAFTAGQIGKSRHSKSGKNLPQGRPRRFFDRKRAKEMREGGMSWRAMEKALKIPQATLRAGLSQR